MRHLEFLNGNYQYHANILHYMQTAQLYIHLLLMNYILYYNNIM